MTIINLQRMPYEEKYAEKQDEQDEHSEKEKKSKVRSDRMFYNTVKRLFDIVVSVIIFAIASPFLAIICLVNAIHLKGNPLFIQKRIKKNGKAFTIFKLRTMVKNADRKLNDLSAEEKMQYNQDFRIPNDPRVTKLGHFLRSTCIDELPQLLNIIKGDMSLVGPRPVLEKELEFYGDKKDLFLSVKPGLTGYWQVYTTEKRSYSDNKRQKMELYYIENRSIILDIKILCKTITTILIRCFKHK